MKKTTYLLLAMTVFVVLFVSACGSAAPATQAAPPPAEVVPTQAPQKLLTTQPACRTCPDLCPCLSGSHLMCRA